MRQDTELDMSRIPESIAIIMDGNGRWAKEKGLPRSAGHVEGVDTVYRITTECARLGVKYLTLYTFSTENWSRPESEVASLMSLVATPTCGQIRQTRQAQASRHRQRPDSDF